jgi:SurA N-terminal domain
VPKKSRLAAGVAVAGACALLAACSPVKTGAAAIVGNDRITSSSLDSHVSNLQQTIAQYGGSQIAADQYPQHVLGWLVAFEIRDELTKTNGITVSQGDIDSEISQLNASAQASVEQSGQSYPGLTVLLAQYYGLPPSLENAFGQWEAQELAFIEQKNGGKIPTASSAQQQAVNQFGTAECRAAKALNIQVNPQYGQLSFDKTRGFYTVIAGSDTLSAASGKKPVTTTPYLPAC